MAAEAPLASGWLLPLKGDNGHAISHDDQDVDVPRVGEAGFVRAAALSHGVYRTSRSGFDFYIDGVDGPAILHTGQVEGQDVLVRFDRAGCYVSADTQIAGHLGKVLSRRAAPGQQKGSARRQYRNISHAVNHNA